MAFGLPVSQRPASGGGGISGPASIRPAATGSGSFFFPTDVPVMYFDDPTTRAWRQFALVGTPAPPAAAGYTTVGNIALTQYADAIRATLISDANSFGNCALIAGALPQNAPWVVTLAATLNTPAGLTFPEVGVGVSNGVASGVSQMTGIAIAQIAGSTYAIHQEIIQVGTGGRIAGNHEVAISPLALSDGSNIHLRLLNDGVALHFQSSTDGMSWWDHYAIASPAGQTDYGFWIGNDFTSGDAICAALIMQNTLTGLTVPQVAVSGATNATPIVITTSSPHGFQSGDMVAIHGVTGNTNANTNNSGGTWNAAADLINVLSSTTFSLVGIAGNGAYAGGGTVTLLSR